MADDYVAAHEGGWRNEKHEAQWTMTLTPYCEPIRKMPVDAIDTEAVLSVLKPLWTRARKPPRAFAGASKPSWTRPRRGPYRSQRSQSGAWRGHLDKLLPKRTKLSRGHHAGHALRGRSGLHRELRQRPATAARALEFCILTARDPPKLGGALGRNRPDGKVWTLPPSARRPGRASRSAVDRALASLREMNDGQVGRFFFPGRRPGVRFRAWRSKCCCGASVANYTAHGFRSSFRDWAGNETHFPRELAEHALAHVIGDKAEQAYRRSDALARRRELMDAWERHCEGAAGENVLAFKRPA